MEQFTFTFAHNLPLKQLIADALGEIERLGYSRRSLRRYRTTWENLIAFADQKQLGDEFSGDLVGRFLEENLVAATSMIRRAVHDAAGGYDESNRGGLEDWDFWIRCAAAGYWGRTIPEYLDWYRRRPTHGDRWRNLGEDGLRVFRERIREQYPRLRNGGFPSIGDRGPTSDRVSGLEIGTFACGRDLRRQASRSSRCWCPKNPALPLARDRFPDRRGRSYRAGSSSPTP